MKHINSNRELHEFYNPKRSELWSNCQYLYTKTNENGKLVDARGNLVDQSVVDNLLKDKEGKPLVDLQDKVWTGEKNTLINDHVVMSYRKTVILFLIRRRLG